MLQLTSGQWSSLYNIFSFGLISMLATTIYTLVGQSRVLPKYRTALVMSSMVTFIAGYHYFRIFNSFTESSVGDSVKVGVGAGTFNEAYRYVDWILTVPLLLVEVIAVLALAKEVSKPLMVETNGPVFGQEFNNVGYYTSVESACKRVEIVLVQANE